MNEDLRGKPMMRNHGCEREFRQEIRSSPQYQALSQLSIMLFQKTRKHKKIEPWTVSSKKIENTQNLNKRIKSLSQSFAWNSDSLREEVLQLARSSDSLARRRFTDRAKFYTARAKKQDPCGDSRAEEYYRVGHREISREDSEASRETEQSRAKFW